MAEQEFIDERIIRYFKGVYSDEDASYVNELFCDNKRLRELIHILSKQFNEFSAEDDEDEKNLDHILFRIHYNINSKSTNTRRWSFEKIIKWTFRIAGIIILPILILIGIQINKERGIINEAWIEIKAPAWTRAKFSLPDGTTGWLNSNSSIKYNMNFNKNRQVSLNGEAYFDVHRDNKRTFLVNTGELSVKVLGTKFNIASYENENNVEVVLEEGKLLFFDKMMQKSYTMNPNNLLVYDKKIQDFTVASVEPQKYSSWTEGKLVFRNDPLDVIARRLERWYNIDIEINGNIDNGPRLRATFLDETLEEVLNLLSRSLKIDYRIEDRILQSNTTYAKKKIILTVKPNKP